MSGSRQSGTRTVIANFSLSLDGRVNGPGGDFDMSWIVPHAVSDGAREHMVQIMGATTALLGRKNYQGFASYWPAVATDTSADPRDRAFAQWLGAVEKVVFSSTLKRPQWNNDRIVDAEPASVVEELRGQSGGDIVVLASGSVIKALFDADELDRLSITLCPEIAGGGRRLFEDGIPASSWRLIKSAATDTGALCLVYERVRENG
jgi:dihydrofolate reductase